MRAGNSPRNLDHTFMDISACRSGADGSERRAGGVGVHHHCRLLRTGNGGAVRGSNRGEGSQVRQTNGNNQSKDDCATLPMKIPQVTISLHKKSKADDRWRHAKKEVCALLAPDRGASSRSHLSPGDRPHRRGDGEAAETGAGQVQAEEE